MAAVGLFAGASMRLEHHDTVPAVAAVFGFVFLIFAGAVYGFHSLMQPTILKHRGISYDSPLATSAATPQNETRQEHAPRRERQVKARAAPTRNAGPSYGAPL
jgi:hypothetical protein